MTADDKRKTITIHDACDLIQVSRRTIYNWINSGKIELVRTPSGAPRIYIDTLWRSSSYESPQAKKTRERARKYGTAKNVSVNSL